MNSSGKRCCSGLEALGKCEKEVELGRRVCRAQRLAVMNAVEGLQAKGVYDQREIELSWQSGCLESKGWNSYLGQVVVPLGMWAWR